MFNIAEINNDTKKTANVNNGTEIIGLKDKALMLKKQFINSKTSGWIKYMPNTHFEKKHNTFSLCTDNCRFEKWVFAIIKIEIETKNVFGVKFP